MKNRIRAFVLACAILGAQLPVTALAAPSVSSTVPAGGDFTAPRIIYETDDAAGTEAVYQTVVFADSDTDWSTYGSDYFYNQMSTQEKAFYDNLRAAANSALTGTGNISSISGAFSGISVNNAIRVATVFTENNPQYYFIAGTEYSTSASAAAISSPNSIASGTVSINIYTDYASGEARAAATEQFKSTIDSLLTQVASQSGDYAKEKKIHDLLVGRLTYSASVSSNAQSTASSLIGDLTVCAGYAGAFQLLCNASGIDCVSVTSSSHEWNEVKLGDSWYNVDVTWDDPLINGNNYYPDLSNISYDYFNKSDATLGSISYESRNAHTPLSMWTTSTYKRPVCGSDYTPGADEKKGNLANNTNAISHGSGMQTPDTGDSGTDPTPVPPTGIDRFTDVRPDAFYYEAVRWGLNKGITSGTSDTTFSPNAYCTRIQAIRFLYHLAGDPSVSLSNFPFTDVRRSDREAVMWAYRLGITNGTTPTTFSPNAWCTRGQIVTFLYNYADEGNYRYGDPDYPSPFDDVRTTAFYYAPVNWAYSNGITSGTTPVTFTPNDYCTRAQIMTFLYREETR